MGSPVGRKNESGEDFLVYISYVKTQAIFNNFMVAAGLNCHSERSRRVDSSVLALSRSDIRLESEPFSCCGHTCALTYDYVKAHATDDARYTFSAKEKPACRNVSSGRDDETQYSYFGARYYDSDLSVWLSVDPMADKLPGHSVYMYAFGNPMIINDPDGKIGRVTKTEQNGTTTGITVSITIFVYANDPTINVNNQAAALQTRMNQDLNNPQGNGPVTISDGTNNVPVTYAVTVIPTTQTGAAALLTSQSGNIVQEQTNNVWQLTNTGQSGAVLIPGDPNGDAYSNVQTLNVNSQAGYESAMMNLLCVGGQYQTADSQVSSVEVSNAATDTNNKQGRATKGLLDLPYTSWKNEQNSPFVNTATTNVTSSTLGNRDNNMTGATSNNLP